MNHPPRQLQNTRLCFGARSIKLGVTWFWILVVLGGCGVTAVEDFTTAERLAAQQKKERFIFYKSALAPESGQMQADLERSDVQQKLADKVYCILVDLYEPNQRFMAQYGVSRAPAVVLIHTDGTYQAHQGPMTEAGVIAFLDVSHAPGLPPRLDAQIPHAVDYQWEGQYSQAAQKAKSSNRRVFIFYKAALNPDCNEILANVLSRQDVARCFLDSVNCLLDWGHAPNRTLMESFGVTNVPAFVIINPDGTYRTLRGMVTAEQLIGFSRPPRTPP